MDRTEILLRRFQLHVDLFKHYLELTLKINVAFYAISGAVVSYVLAHPGDRMSQAGLLIPLVLGLGLTTVGVFGALMLGATRRDLLSIRDELGLETIPEIRVLSLLLWVSAAGFLTVSVAVVVLWLAR